MSKIFESLLSKRSIRIGAAALFTVAIIGFAWPYFSLQAFKSIAGHMNFKLAILAFAFYLLITVFRAFRFMAAGARFNFFESLAVASIHAALVRVMPLRSGELAYGFLKQRLGKGGFGQGMAEIVMLRILDVSTVLLLVAAVFLSAVFEMSELSRLPILAGAALFMMLIFFAFGPLLKRAAKQFSPNDDNGSIRKIVGRVLKVCADTYDLPYKRKLILIGLTIAHWSVVVIWLNTTIAAVGLVDEPSRAFLASIFGISGSVVPLSLIGTFGPLESGLAVGLKSIGHNSEIAAAGALMISTLSFIFNWLAAVPAWIALIATGALSGKPLFSRKRENNKNGESFAVKVTLGTACFAIAGGLLLLFRIRYAFETSDHFQYLLLPYRSIFDNFLTNDWFTWKTTHYHVVFSLIIRTLHTVFGQSGFPSAVFAVHLLVLTGVAYAFSRLSKAAGWHWLSALIGLLIVAFINQQGMGQATINHGILLPADMAMPPFLLGLACLIERRALAAGLWLGLCGLMHANFAALCLPMMIPFAYSAGIKQRNIREIARLFIGFIALAWPSLWIALKGFLFSDSSPDALDVIFNIRSPHHYNPDLGHSIEIFWLITLIIAGLPVLIARGRSEAVKTFCLFTAMLAAFQIAAGIAEILEWRFFIRLFLWRYSAPLIAIAAVAAGETLIQAIKKRGIFDIAFALSSAIVIAAFSTPGAVKLSGSTELYGFAMLFPALIPLALSAVLVGITDRKWAKIAGASLPVLVLCWSLFLTIPNAAVLDRQTLKWSQAFKKWSAFAPVVIDSNKRGGRYAIYQWIQENTPKDALFLTPPGLDDFRLNARRGIYVDWKCCPMKGDEALEWQRRMLASMGERRFKVKGYALYDYANKIYFSRPLSDLAALARKEGLTYIFTRSRSDEADAGIKQLFHKSGWAVYWVE